MSADIYNFPVIDGADGLPCANLAACLTRCMELARECREEARSALRHARELAASEPDAATAALGASFERRCGMLVWSNLASGYHAGAAAWEDLPEETGHAVVAEQQEMAQDAERMGETTEVIGQMIGARKYEKVCR